MKIINTATADLGKMSTLEQLALYNGMDNLALPEIHARLSKELDPIREATYRFEIDLQAPLLEMSFNGIHTDATERARLIGVNEQAKTKVEGYLHTLLSAIGYYEYYRTIARARFACQADIDLAAVPRTWADWVALPIATRKELKAKAGAEATKDLHKRIKQLDQPFNADSNAQKMRLFYHFFGHSQNQISRDEFEDFPPPWNKTHGISEYKTRNQKGEYTPSVDRDCLEKLRLRANGPVDAAYWALPFISCCLAIADYSKSLQFLRCKLENGMFRSSFATGPETGRLSSRRNAQGYGWNAQNVAPPLRTIFTCLPGWKMATPDYEQIESRNVGAICFRLFGATAYLDACQCGDLHTLVCSMIWPDLPWPEEFTIDFVRKYGVFPSDIIKAAKKIANEKFYRNFSRRDLSKRGGHGSNYLGKPPHMAKMLHVETSIMQHYQDAYFEIFPEIPQWHKWVVEQVQSAGEITTFLGRKRQFFGRPSDDATIREAVAFEPQSIAADYTNSALLALHKAALYNDLPLVLFLQKHDEIGFRYLEAAEAELLPEVRTLMEQTITLTAPDGSTREWRVPTEMQSGWNLGKYNDKNPDGVLEWTGNDPRTRTRNPFDIKNLVL